jgi:hypothetical protein
MPKAAIFGIAGGHVGDFADGIRTISTGGKLAIYGWAPIRVY